MKKTISGLIIIALIFIGAVLLWPKKTIEEKGAEQFPQQELDSSEEAINPEESEDTQSSEEFQDDIEQLSNPASVYCIGQGGELEIRIDAEGGQFGVCIFKDGSECEEWAFFRGECSPGDRLE